MDREIIVRGNSAKRVWWIRIGVSAMPNIYNEEPTHITHPEKRRRTMRRSGYKGEVIEVVEMAAYRELERQLEELRKRYVIPIEQENK